jgi:single-stranded-DNA-specific exonuclease
MMEKRWTYTQEADNAKSLQLQQELGISKIHTDLLVQRGIYTFEEAKAFFRPSVDDLLDPYLMADMQKAVDRILAAFGDGERIMVFGDYDVDGTTAVATMFSVLSTVTNNIEYYIPNRYTEGYGLSKLGIETAKRNGVSLMIVLDCGVKSIELVDFANQLGLDIIICDHHRPGKELPRAVAVLDPVREDCNYPCKVLCGCGVGFKLLHALSIAGAFSLETCLEKVDLVAVAIGADIVPIIGENRTIAWLGLQKINHNPSQSLKAILETAKFKGALSVSDVVFVIGPRLNAAGRIESGNRSVELLVASEEKATALLSEVIDKHNQTRKELDKKITQEALRQIEDNPTLLSAKTTVVFDNSWHKGVVGIVASRLTENYYRPTIVLTESNGKATGSARSVKDFDVYNAIDACSDLLEQFGGHAFAAGMTMPLENVAAFAQKFEDVVANSITAEQLTPVIEIDHEIDLADISDKFFSIIKQMAPFGPGNMNPVFVTHNCINAEWTKVVGEEHLKLHICQKHNPSVTANGIAFRMAEFAEDIIAGKPFSIAYSIEENTWNGKVSLQLNIKDLKFNS